MLNSLADLFKATFGDNLETCLKILNNPVYDTDSYKLSHKNMEPNGTTKIFSNLTPRFNHYFKKRCPNHDGKVVVFNTQGFVAQELKYTWDKYFFNRPLEEVMAEIELIFFPYLGMNKTKLSHFEALHKLGYLPLKVKSLPEGSVVPIGTPVMTVTNTHPAFSWLTNYVESIASLSLYKPMTVATTARSLAQLRDTWWDQTVSDHTFKSFAIHDFSLRGHDAKDAARSCGAAALLYSSGTDNVPGLVYARTMYNAGPETAFSVAASEHSVTTLGINFYKDMVLEGELKELVDQLINRLTVLGLISEFEQAKGELITIYRLITERFPEGILSYVADSYDYWRVLTILLPILRPVILRRNGKLVIRPDSGDPVDMVVGESRNWIVLNTKAELNDFMVDAEDGQKFSYEGKAYEVTGYDDYEREYGNQNLGQVFGFTNIPALINSCNILTEITDVNATSPEWKGSIEILDEIFGSTINDKGYKELAPQIGLIYGDGINYDRANGIFSGLADKGYAASNVVLGVGSYTFASSTRDDLGFAIKATHAIVDDISVPIYKKPKTDSGKNSAKGLLSVVLEDGVYKTLNDVTPEQEESGLLQTIFEDSQLFNITVFEEVKQRLN